MANAFDDDNFDWTNGDQAETTAVADALDFVIPQFAAATDVEATEQEAEDSKFAAPPPGSYTFEITGFLKAPEQITKTGYVGNQPVTYRPYKVAMKLRVVGAGNLSMLDNIELPPSSPKELGYFQAATKAPNGDRRFAGFMNKKLEHLIKRIGFAFAAGEPIPAEALSLRNWVGRRVVANVVAGKPQIDPVTGQPRCDPGTGLPYPARPQIELFSYREAESTAVANGQGGPQASAGHPGQPGQAAQRPAPPRVPGGQPAPTGQQHVKSFAQAGLNNV